MRENRMSGSMSAGGKRSDGGLSETPIRKERQRPGLTKPVHHRARLRLYYKPLATLGNLGGS